MRFATIGAMLALVVANGGVAYAQSKCDAAITKAAGKKAVCRAGIIGKAQQKGTTPDATKLGKCASKFDKACSKAKTKGGCTAQLQTCSAIEAEVDSCVATFSTGGSPSGAFLN